MKHLFLITLTALLAFSACRKGEDDPFLSLKSRKARLAGQWTLISSSEKRTSSSESYTSISASEFSNGKQTGQTTTTTPSGTTVSNQSTDYTENYTFEKDGKYSFNHSEDGNNISENGTWLFLGKGKKDELKKKEAIMLVPDYYKINEEEGTTLTGINDDRRTIILQKLAKDEMIWVISESYSSSDGSKDDRQSKYTFQKN